MFSASSLQVRHLPHLLCRLFIQLETNQGGISKRGQGGCRFLFVPSCVLVTQSWFPAGFSAPLGSLGGIYSAMEGRRRRAHAASFTITWKFPAVVTHSLDAISCARLILAVPRESWSVTKQIIVYCFLSRRDRC